MTACKIPTKPPSKLQLCGLADHRRCSLGQNCLHLFCQLYRFTVTLVLPATKVVAAPCLVLFFLLRLLLENKHEKKKDIHQILVNECCTFLLYFAESLF